MSRFAARAKAYTTGARGSTAPPHNSTTPQRRSRSLPRTRRWSTSPESGERLRHLGTDRERLFQAFLEGNVGDLFVRVGRQNLSWGETDAFQLLDHINPIDSSFGGFLISLDERRVPLDMLMSNYYLGDMGPITEAHLEGFVAIDNTVGYYPGTPAGSPWALPSLGAPSNTTEHFLIRPARTVGNARGGFQLKFNALERHLWHRTLLHLFRCRRAASEDQFSEPSPASLPRGAPVPAVFGERPTQPGHQLRLCRTRVPYRTEGPGVGGIDDLRAAAVVQRRPRRVCLLQGRAVVHPGAARPVSLHQPVSTRI